MGIDETLAAEADGLELFACASSGINHLPVELLRERGVTVTNAAGIHAPGIAEQAVGNILAFSRRLHEGWKQKQNREWRHYQASELTGCTVTVVGLGSIGTAVTRRLAGFGVDTIGVRYTPSKGGPTDEVIGFDETEFHSALAETDYLVIACPLTDETRGLVGKEELVTLPPEAVVVNTARGAIIDTDALLWAIRDGCLRGAALDVTDPEPLPEDHPLWSFGNVLITPHMGGHTTYHWPRLADILAENVKRLGEDDTDRPLRNQVLPTA
ncbi:D-isomer specific 2-hydroxyacid dehydrogenase NAD-binding protein [Halosimplex carlsbadense 2-9-1]|uniref:D-isomer specific 2-hydroxyacid dehydrogenase NAD-binding protein n=1 Tax=Halosimplex carlsbadense 2-9-1 TaxID=797114 RepID=M0D082_9EURY|nr:D-isomer specific 2-hydroxyacid dehydrogenase NAD-binding protein [Halosimplex carlsbadense 2-9-1]